MKTLIAIDGSKHSLNAVKYVVKHASALRQNPTVELVYVHLPLPYLPRVKSVVGKDVVQNYYKEEGAAALAGAKRALETSGIDYRAHILVGPIAESIVQHAKKASCDVIVIATRGMGAAGNLLLGSIATKVLHLSDRPGLVVK